MTHQPDQPPSLDIGPEDWPFTGDFPNLISFAEILGEQHPPDSIPARENEPSERRDRGES